MDVRSCTLRGRADATTVYETLAMVPLKVPVLTVMNEFGDVAYVANHFADAPRDNVEVQGNGNLIAEAFTVAAELKLSPVQLADHRKLLLVLVAAYSARLDPRSVLYHDQECAMGLVHDREQCLICQSRAVLAIVLKK